MKYNITNPPFQYYMKNSTCYCSTKLMTINGIIIRSVSKKKLKNYIQPIPIDYQLINLVGYNKSQTDLNHISKYFGVNAWIGETKDGSITTIQTMPWDYKSYGCGNGKFGSCDNGFIQIAICKNNDKISQIEIELKELLQYLCNLYNINPIGKIKFQNGLEIPTILTHNEAFNFELCARKDYWIDHINLSSIKNSIISNSNINIKYFRTPKKIEILSKYTRIYKEPTEDSDLYNKYSKLGEKLKITEIYDNFGKLANKKGWINLNCVRIEE